MVEPSTKSSENTEDEKVAQAPGASHPFETLRREVDRLFEDFDPGFWRAPFRRSVFNVEPFWRRDWSLATVPAVDIVEKDGDYQITAELPGMDEKDIELKVVDGMLTIKGEKLAEKEEKKKDYHLQERRFGAFTRSFRIPEGADTDKITAEFAKGLLKVTMPKKPQTKKPEKRIEVKSA